MKISCFFVKGVLCVYILQQNYILCGWYAPLTLTKQATTTYNSTLSFYSDMIQLHGNIALYSKSGICQKLHKIHWIKKIRCRSL
jgi:hypothetical protein